jgi:hypothetical protein
MKFTEYMKIIWNLQSIWKAYEIYRLYEKHMKFTEYMKSIWNLQSIWKPYEIYRVYEKHMKSNKNCRLTYLFIYCLLQVLRITLHVSSVHAGHSQSMLCKEILEAALPFLACRDWNLGRLYTPTFTVKKQITKLVFDRLSID